ncbi:ABC transporter ATP-binding protein [Thauera chlorobenzoica]|uniref:Branched-chain amino acid ABC transporter ATP-binding protein n=1 Tax=Thauera chlorobenzoica TaxID=96773 RepID=A0A1H5T7S7_9RHOO|nr:ABC transporter ATP-binding protein [Thauera chlorobenzoica]APR04236.1 Branched-chain amino acid ABC transporter ATP-binding protein [Thauera chlorobenzoica]SEF58846.1 amino acid/amide ABC transporter ATP-binding protein 2, HAAT family [Thauera chlorobenzoica]
MALLEMKDVRGGYGDTDILQGVSLTVGAREIVVIVGPNGAGKSTAMKAVFGLLEVRGGSVVFDGEDITGWAPHRIVRRGICYVPQVDNVFREMTVHENFEMGAFLRRGELSAAFDRVYGLFPDLKAKRRNLAGDLSGGQRQMVAMGRALMLSPKLLLLDEPTAGLSPKYMEQIFRIARDVRDAGVSILLVEQHAKQALAFCDRGYVLATGANRHQGTGGALLADRDVAEMFLGG